MGDVVWPMSTASRREEGHVRIGTTTPKSHGGGSGDRAMIVNLTVKKMFPFRNVEKFCFDEKCQHLDSSAQVRLKTNVKISEFVARQKFWFSISSNNKSVLTNDSKGSAGR